jgi:NAD-dependent deacetylase
MTRNNIIAQLLVADHIVFFTGAGMSADSGIPTFRDGAGALWNDIDPMTVASLQGFEADPDKVWDWHLALKSGIENALPNRGHEAIAALEQILSQARITVITQNIDGLHQLAGSREVIELHGTVNRIRCHEYCGYETTWDDMPVSRICPDCGAQIRPDVVWFGEGLDEYSMSDAQQAAAAADMIFVVGTSSLVQPAASIPLLAQMNGATLVEINPSETKLSGRADYSVRASASEFFPLICEEIQKRRLRERDQPCRTR